MNAFDFGYEVLGLGNDVNALDAFLEMIGAWRHLKTVQSCEPLGFLVWSLARQARPAAGSPLSLMIVGHEQELSPELVAHRHLRDFLDELPLGEHTGEVEAAPAVQAFLRGWTTGYTGSPDLRTGGQARTRRLARGRVKR